MFSLWGLCRVQQVHEKWVNIRTLLQTKLSNILNIHTNPDFKFLAECTEWVHQKLVSEISPLTLLTPGFFFSLFPPPLPPFFSGPSPPLLPLVPPLPIKQPKKKKKPTPIRETAVRLARTTTGCAP